MEANIVNVIAQNILEQLKCIPFPVRASWGMHDLKADCIKPGEYEMAALSFLVQGFNFKGRIWIALNEGADLYEVYGQRKGAHEMTLLDEDVFCEDLSEILDTLIETGCEKAKEFYSKELSFAEVANAIISGKPIGEEPEDVPCEEVPSPTPSEPAEPSSAELSPAPCRRHSLADIM